MCEEVEANMRFNPTWHELLEKLGGAQHLSEFMPAKLKDNEAVDLLIELIGEEVEAFCGTDEAGIRLIEIMDTMMCVAYTAGYKAAQADTAAEEEMKKSCPSA